MMEQHETSVGKEKLVPNLGQDIVNASGFNCVNTMYSRWSEDFGRQQMAVDLKNFGVFFTV